MEVKAPESKPELLVIALFLLSLLHFSRPKKLRFEDQIEALPNYSQRLTFGKICSAFECPKFVGVGFFVNPKATSPMQPLNWVIRQCFLSRLTVGLWSKRTKEVLPHLAVQYS